MGDFSGKFGLSVSSSSPLIEKEFTHDRGMDDNALSGICKGLCVLPHRRLG
jgi:hypothetical protein